MAETKATKLCEASLVAFCTGALQSVKDMSGKVRVLGFIIDLTVVESQKRRGIGSAMMRAMEKSLVQAGAEAVQAHVLFDQQSDSWGTFVTSNSYKPASATRIYGWPTTIPASIRAKATIVEEIDTDTTLKHWNKWFASGGLYPEDPRAILESPQCKGTFYAKQGEAEACVTLWDSSSVTRFLTTSVGLRAKIVNILMSLWSGAKLPTAGGDSLRANTLVGVYAAGTGSKDLFQGLISHVHSLAHKDGVDMMLCPLDFSSTRQYALPYWNVYSTEVVTVAKRFALSGKGSLVEPDVDKSQMFEDISEEGEAKKHHIGFVRGFLDPRYMLL